MFIFKLLDIYNNCGLSIKRINDVSNLLYIDMDTKSPVFYNTIRNNNNIFVNDISGRLPKYYNYIINYLIDNANFKENYDIFEFIDYSKSFNFFSACLI